MPSRSSGADLRGADIVGLLIGMSLFSMFFFISLYLQNVLHYSPIKTGHLLSAPCGRDHLVSWGRLQLVNRFGFKTTLIAGLVLIAGGLIWFSQVPGPGGSTSPTYSARRCSPRWDSGSHSCR